MKTEISEVPSSGAIYFEFTYNNKEYKFVVDTNRDGTNSDTESQVLLGDFFEWFIDFTDIKEISNIQPMLTSTSDTEDVVNSQAIKRLERLPTDSNFHSSSESLAKIERVEDSHEHIIQSMSMILEIIPSLKAINEKDGKEQRSELIADLLHSLAGKFTILDFEAAMMGTTEQKNALPSKINNTILISQLFLIITQVISSKTDLVEDQSNEALASVLSEEYRKYYEKLPTLLSDEAHNVGLMSNDDEDNEILPMIAENIEPDKLISVVEILDELITNAKKYAKKNTKINIEYSENDDGNIVIFIANQASKEYSIPDEAKEKIFIQDYRLNPKDKKGTGRGLWRMALKVKELKGKIYALPNSDKPDKYKKMEVFMLELPAQLFVIE